MALARVQEAHDHTTANTSLTVTLGATPSNGNLLIALIRENDGSSTITLPTNGGTWQWVTGHPFLQGTARQYGIAYCNNISSATTSVSFSSTVSALKSMYVWEVSGQATSNVFDKSNSNVGTSGTSHTTGSTGTLSQANEFVVAGMGWPAAVSSPSVDSGFTIEGALSTELLRGAYLITSATTALNPTFSWTTNRIPSGCIASFKEAASGTTHSIAATGSGQTDGTARLDIRHDLRATGTGTSDGSAALTLDVLHIGATGTGQTAGSAELRATLMVTATGSGTTDGSAAISRLHQLTATGTGQTDGSAAITIVSANTHQITATGTGTTDGTAALRVSMGLTALGEAQTGGSVALRATIVLALSPGTGTSGGSVSLGLINRLTATGTGQTSGSVNITIPTVHTMQASGSSVTGGTASIEIVAAVWFFSPPTHEEPIKVRVGALDRYTLTYAKSIYRTDAGTFTSRRMPPPWLLTGEEGVDYFLGGREYLIPAAVANELIAAGYSPTPT